jgi:hypothetical protein
MTSCHRRRSVNEINNFKDFNVFAEFLRGAEVKKGYLKGTHQGKNHSISMDSAAKILESFTKDENFNQTDELSSLAGVIKQKVVDANKFKLVKTPKGEDVQANNIWNSIFSSSYSFVKKLVKIETTGALGPEFKELKKAADKGDSRAQRLLARRFEAVGNQVMAFKYFKKSADQGDPHSLNMVGVCYMKGKGAKQNWDKAFDYLVDARKAGNIDAVVHLCEYYRERHKNSRSFQDPYLKEIKERGYTDNLYVSGINHERKQNKKMALESYQKASDNGSGAGSEAMSRFYQEGIYVEKDEAQAQKYKALAIEQERHKTTDIEDPATQFEDAEYLQRLMAR